MIYDYNVRIVVNESPVHFYRTIQTDIVDDTLIDPSFSETSVRDFVIEHMEDNIPTCDGNSPSDLKIRTNVGSAIVDDDYTVSADPSDKKYVKMSIVRVDATGAIEILAFEKTTGSYGGMPAGKTLEKDLKEFSVVASGTELVEEDDFI